MKGLFGCYRTMTALREENLSLKFENRTLAATLVESDNALKAFRRNILSEIATLSERVSALEAIQGIDNQDASE